MAKKVTKKKTTAKKATTRKKTTSKKTAKAAPALTDEQIRMRAFEIYRSGRNPSNPEADWFQAEEELKTQIAS